MSLKETEHIHTLMKSNLRSNLLFQYITDQEMSRLLEVTQRVCYDEAAFFHKRGRCG